MLQVSSLSRWSQISSWRSSFSSQISDSCRKVAYVTQDTWQYTQGKAANILGYYCRHDKKPVDCFSPLDQLRTTTYSFESHQQKDLAHFGAQPAKLPENQDLPKQKALLAVALEAPEPSELSDAKAPPPPVEVEGKEALTNSEVKFAAENFSALGLLSYMRSSLCSIHEPDSSHLRDLIRESKQTGGSLWKLFMRDYGKQINWFQWIGCAFAYFLYSLIGPLTATTCSSRVVEEIRTFFREKKNVEEGKSDPKKLEKFNRTLVIIIDNFCTAYKAAAKNYDEANPRAGKFEDYLETAITNAVGKTLEDLQSASSKSIASHFSPEISFHWLVRKPLNWIVSFVMKKKILPLVSRSIAEGWIRSTDRSNIPFFLAITEILTEQLLKLEQEGFQNNGESAPAPPSGTEKLAIAIRKLMISIEISSCKDIGDGAIHGLLGRIQKREDEEANGKELSNQEDAKIRTGLEGSIVKASHVLFHYLADPKNREDLLGKFAKQLNAPFSEVLPEKTENDLTNSQVNLNETALRIFWNLCRNAVKAEVPGGIPSEIMKKLAEKTFQYEKEYLQKISDRLALFSQQMMQKAKQEYLNLNDKDNLFPYLIAMVDQLKQFDDNRKELKKQLASLNDAKAKGMHHVLDPLFQEAKELAKALSEMQKIQEHHLYHRQAAKAFAEISDKLPLIAKNTALDPKESLEAIEEILSKAESPLIPDQEGKKSPIPFLKAKFKEISSLSTSLFSHHEALKTLYVLAPEEEEEQKSGLIRELAAYVRREKNFLYSRGFNKRKYLDQTIKKVGLLTSDSQKELFLEADYESQEKKDLLLTLIQELNDSSPYDLSFEEKIWKPLTACLKDHQVKRRKEIEAHQARLKQSLQDFADHVKKYSEEYNQRIKANLADLQEKSAAFHRRVVGYKENNKQIPGFQAKVASLQPEEQIEIDQKRLASHLAVLGASSGALPYETAGLLAGGYLGETFGAILGTSIGFVADIGAIKFFPRLAPLARVAASAFAGVYARQQATDTVDNVEKIYEEKGNFLKNALTFKALSRTCWGVAAAVTEVGAVVGLQQLGVNPLATSLVLTASSAYLGSQLSRTVQALEKGVEIGMNKVLPKVEATFKGAYKLLLAPENYRGLFRFSMKEFIAAYPS